MSQDSHNRKVTAAGVILTIAVTVGFVWAGWQWINRYKWPRRLSTKEIQANEIKAFKNLQLICQAQEKYKETDRDEDGKKSYAKFFAHLWTAVNKKSEPVLLNLIPKKVAFATVASRACNGYYFVDVRERVLSEDRRIGKLDYEKEWAIAAVPARKGTTGLLTFLADSPGEILAKNFVGEPSPYPYAPLSDGWMKVENVQQLKDFQKTIKYPKK